MISGAIMLNVGMTVYSITTNQKVIVVPT